MKVSLLRKRHNLAVIFFILLSSLIGKPLSAFRGAHGHGRTGSHGKAALDDGGPRKVGNRLYFTPACPIITQSFQNSADGALSDPSATGWFLDRTNVGGAVYFAAKSHRIKAQTLGGEGVWYSQVFSIAGYTNIQVDAKVSSEGSFTSSEYVKVYYKLDGGPETLISAQYGSFGTPTVTSGMMTGSTVQLVIRIYNISAGNNDYYVENYDVFKETGPCTVTGITVTANPTNSGILTCAHPTTTITASTTASGTTTYSWTGPNGYTATGSSITVSTAGTYTATGTNSAGTGSASVSVTANNSAPDVTATGGALGCASSITISANSSVSGVTYSWTGPNSFTSSAQSPTVTAAGTYTVTVTNPATGCTSSTSVTVTSGAAVSAFWLEDFTLANGTTSDAGATAWTATTTATGTYTYSVQNNEFKTSFTGQNVGTWTSGSISLAGKSNTVLSVNLRSETASSGDAFETADYVRVYLRINSRADSLIYEDLAGIGTSTTGTSAMTLTSGAFNGDSVRVIIVTSNSDPTERYYFDNVTLTGTPTSGTVVASGGTITCTKSSVTLTGTYSGSGATYSWTGPNGFTSTTQNPTVSTAGIYTLTVTAGGCTATDTANVLSNTTVPGAVTASAASSLTCTTTSVGLTGSSSTSGVTYAWTGPNSFTSSTQNPTVSTAGVYTLTVTNTANGCTATDTANVLSNAVAPATPTTTPNPSNATLTCATNFVTLSGSSSTSGVTYAWTGPNNFNVASSSANAFSAGTYTLTATIASTGCKSTANVTVIQNTTPPQLSPISPSAATLTCSSPSATLTGSSSTTGVTYSWAGPNSFTGTGTTAVATTQGSYILTVTDPTNGCTNTTTAAISQNFTPPAQVTAFNNGPLTCAITSVTLTGNSQTAGVTYAWTGPNNFTASGATATTGVAGTYTLTVTNPVNGCTTITNTVVAQNTTTPAGLAIASNTGATLLTCTSPSITLTASTTATSGITFNWAGPGNFTSSAASISATSPGTYLVTATNSSNGCTASTSADVTQNTTPPASPLLTSNPLNALLSCTTTSIALNANSSNPNVGYTWTGPGGFTFNGMTTSVNVPGTYTVTATDPANGCRSTSSAVVTEDTTHPTLVATSSLPANSLLTCTNTSVIITASSGTSGVTYGWTGPNGFTANGISATVTTPGNYTVTVTNPNNGCSTSVTASTVTQNTNVPNAVSATVSNKLTCSASSATLRGSSSTTGVSYTWTGPNNFTASTQITNVSAGGTYTLTATDPANGCTFSAPITVQVDKTAPQGVTATSDGNLSCTVGSVTLSGNSTTTGVTYSWAGPNGFIDPEKVVSAVDSGTYFLTVNNPANGCTAVASVTVTADFTECSMIAPKQTIGHAASLNNASTGNTAAGSGLIYKVYPNPVNTTAFVNLTSPERKHVSVEIYNSVGIREKVLFDGTVEAGIPYQWTLDASRFAAGIHYCIIRTNNKSYTSKLLISSGRP